MNIIYYWQQQCQHGASIAFTWVTILRFFVSLEWLIWRIKREIWHSFNEVTALSISSSVQSRAPVGKNLTTVLHCYDISSALERGDCCRWSIIFEMMLIVFPVLAVVMYTIWIWHDKTARHNITCSHSCAPTVPFKTSKLSDWHSQWWTPKLDGKVR